VRSGRYRGRQSESAVPGFVTGFSGRESGFRPPVIRRIFTMSKPSKIKTLAVSREIPFNKLILSQANVRTVKTGVSIEELSEDIANRGLLQSLYVRPVIGSDGLETGLYEVPAGGRRFRALERLIKAKRLAKDVMVPCIVRDTGIAEEDSLAENTQREALHPVDQFRAFQTLVDKGMTEEDIAARFFVTATIVKQRLRLAAVSPKLLDIYVDEGMTLDQLMAFTVTTDHARQEQVWESIGHGYNKQPYTIRRMLTETAVAATDRRVRLIGVEAYEAAGGTIIRDLFEDDGGGWLQDPALLDRLVHDRLKQEAETLSAEGWKWIAVAPDFPYGHTNGMREIDGEQVDMTNEEIASRAALEAEAEALEAEYAEADELPDEVDQRLGEIETLIQKLDERPMRFDPDEIARAGVFVSLSRHGDLIADRGYVRPEDEAPAEAAEDEGEAGATGSVMPRASGVTAIVLDSGLNPPPAAEDDEEGLKPLSNALLTELSVFRTAYLRQAVATNAVVAYLAVLHAMVIDAFYIGQNQNCLQIRIITALQLSHVEVVKQSDIIKANRDRHDHWKATLPRDPKALWDHLVDLDEETRSHLFAFCAGMTVNAVSFNPRAVQAHVELLARETALDIAAAGWKPTVENYLGRVSKPHILAAVTEALGEEKAQLIAHLKKGDMAREAERLLADTGWLPEALRTLDAEMIGAEDGDDDDSTDVEDAGNNVIALPAFLDCDEQPDGEVADPTVIAAE